MKIVKTKIKKLKASIANIMILLSILSGMSLVLISLSTPTVSAATLIVPSGPYPSIQSAIDDASSGDTIRVYAGTYLEILNIDKTLTLEGNGSSDTIIDGNHLGTVITISASWVTVTGFTQYGLLSGLLF